MGDALLRRTRIGLLAARGVADPERAPRRSASRVAMARRAGVGRRAGAVAPRGPSSTRPRAEGIVTASVTFSTLAGCIPATGPVDLARSPARPWPAASPCSPRSRRSSCPPSPARPRPRASSPARRSTVRARTSSRSATSTSRATAPARWPTSSAWPGSTTSSSRGWSTGPSSPPSRSTPAWPAPARSRSSRPRTAAASSWPSSAAAAIFTTVRPRGRAGLRRHPAIAASGDEPRVDMSINGVAYLTWSAGGDVLAARMERDATAFNGVPAPLDIDPAAVAGTGTGRPKVAVAADGVATVVWGESGARLRAADLRAAPVDRPAGPRRAAPTSPTSPARTTRASPGSCSARAAQTDRAAARRLAVRRPGRRCRPPRAPRRRAWPSTAAASATRASPARRRRAPTAPCSRTTSSTRRVLLGGGFAAPAPVPAVAETGDGLIAFQQGDADRRARGPSRAPTTTCPRRGSSRSRAPDATLSDPALGPTDAVARARGRGRPRRRRRDRLRPGRRRRAPDRRRQPRPRAGLLPRQHDDQVAQVRAPAAEVGDGLRAVGAADLQRADRRQAGRADHLDRRDRAGVVADGLHRWRVVATDIRGQSTRDARRATCASTPRRRRSPTRSRASRKRGKPVKVAVQATDASGTAAKASGLDHVRISFGDGSRAVTGLRAIHRYGHSGKVTVRISARRQGRQRGRQDAADHDPQVARAGRSTGKARSVRATVRRAVSCRPSRNVGCRAVRVPSGEPELVRAAAAGDPAALAALWDAYGPRVFAFCQRVLGRADAAADAAQDAFLLAHAELGGLARTGESFGTAVFQAARTTCFDLLARDRARAARAAGRPPSLSAAAARLRPQQRAALALSGLEGLRYAEIAAVLGVGAEAVGALLARARLRLHDELHGTALAAAAVRSPDCEDVLAAAGGRRPTASSAPADAGGPTRTSGAARRVRARAAPWTRRPRPTRPGRPRSRPRGCGRRPWPSSGSRRPRPPRWLATAGALARSGAAWAAACDARRGGRGHPAPRLSAALLGASLLAVACAALAADRSGSLRQRDPLCRRRPAARRRASLRVARVPARRAPAARAQHTGARAGRGRPAARAGSPSWRSARCTARRPRRAERDAPATGDARRGGPPRARSAPARPPAACPAPCPPRRRRPLLPLRRRSPPTPRPTSLPASPRAAAPATTAGGRGSAARPRRAAGYRRSRRRSRRRATTTAGAVRAGDRDARRRPERGPGPRRRLAPGRRRARPRRAATRRSCGH